MAIGNTSKLAYRSGALSATKKYLGEFFSVPPQIELRDAGGNVNVNENKNAVQVSIFGNPTQATIGPESSLFVVAKKGIVNFNALRIDKSGSNYTLLFRLYKYNKIFSNYSASDISFLSEKFEVQDGLPRKLQIVVPASGAWAGNQVYCIYFSLCTMLFVFVHILRRLQCNLSYKLWVMAMAFSWMTLPASSLAQYFLPSL